MSSKPNYNIDIAPWSISPKKSSTHNSFSLIYPQSHLKELEKSHRHLLLLISHIAGEKSQNRNFKKNPKKTKQKRMKTRCTIIKKRKTWWSNKTETGATVAEGNGAFSLSLSLETFIYLTLHTIFSIILSFKIKISKI